MSFRLTVEQIDDLLEFCGSKPRYWKDGETQVCCPVHGESNPSMGVSYEKQVCHCFSCGFKGGFARLLARSRPDDFGLDLSTQQRERATSVRAERNALEFLRERYELEFHLLSDSSGKPISRYEELRKPVRAAVRSEMPLFKLAPFMSGKETFSYFYERGFDSKDVREYMIGRDLDSMTITIPVFYEDGALAGIIGRYIDPTRKKNERYKVYKGFQRGNVLYPLNLSAPVDDTVILVEGQFDAMRLRKLGYSNAFATLTNEVSDAQAKWLCEHCSAVIYVGDNDKRGIEGREASRMKLKGNLSFKTVEYPAHGKDVCEWSDSEIAAVIASARGSQRKVRRYAE